MAAGSIVVDLLMKTGSFETDVQRATKTTEKETKKMTQAFEAYGAAVGISLTGIIGTLGVLTTKVINTGVEIDRFAKLAGTSATEFQRLGFAAQSVGIQNDKLADIMKDVQDKVGDFLVTGGGPLADFFEKIAPQVGVTADQFAKLSGPEALQLYVSSLQKANLTQAEMIFFLEAIASDASLLLPLLQNNGAAMQKLGDDAQRLGKVISDDTIKATVEFDRNLKELQGTIDSLAVAFAGPILTGINGLINQFRLGAREGEGFLKTLLRQTEIARLIGQGNPIIDPSKVGGKQPTFSRDDQSTAEARRLGLLKAPPPAAVAVPRLPRISGGRASRPNGLDFSAQDAEIDRITKEFERLEAERLRQIQQTQDEARRIYESTRTPLERLNAETAKLDELLAKGAISWDTYSRAVLAAEEQYRPFVEETKAATNELAELGNELGLTFSSAFEDAIAGGKGFSEVLKGLEQDIIRIVTRKLFTEPFGDFLTGAIKSVFPSGGGLNLPGFTTPGFNPGSGGGIGDFFSNIGSTIAGFFGGAFAGGGNVLGGRPILVGENGPEMFMPRTAGVVIPNDAMTTQPRTNMINVNVTAQPGMSRDTAIQQGARIAQGINGALQRNG